MNNEQPAPGRRDLAPGAPGYLAPGAPGHQEPGAPGHSGRDRVSDPVGSSEKVQVRRGHTYNFCTLSGDFQFLTNSDAMPVPLHGGAWPNKTCYYVSL